MAIVGFMGLLCLRADAATGKVVTIANESLRLSVDLAAGTYSVSCVTSGAVAVSNACATVESWTSKDTGYACEVGKKRRDRLLIECARADAPTLLLEFRLHQLFLELRTGLKNTTREAVRIKKFQPLAGGVVFPGAGWTDVRTLDAPTGANQSSISNSAVRSSANNLLLTFRQSGVRRSLVLGALKTADFAKQAHTMAGAGSAGVTAALDGYDPVGRLVDPGETYMPDDSFYVGFTTPNPFDALEQYGLALREATGARPNFYDFPTVCAWYAGVWKTKGAQDHPEKSTYKINTSSGLVEEAEKIKACGFLKYSRAAGRLIPDNYTPNNPQGWWDDEHWRQHGIYTAPFESSPKYGAGMHSNGVLAFTYIQINPLTLSKDFREQHTGWLCAGSMERMLDYSLPEVQAYVKKRFRALRGHIDGLMVDYCDECWDNEIVKGSFFDAHMTGVAFYRQFFRLVKDGLGPDSWLHERCVMHPNNDLTLGITDSQRTSGDTDKVSPDMVSRSGLRWYKNRVVINYDMDSKELNNAWKAGGWNGSDRDGRRMLLTVAYVAASRLVTANSFRDLSSETLRDLERTFPYPVEPRSARPVDAFVCEGWPRVYDFAVNSDWHQVTLYNNVLPTRPETFVVPLAGDAADGALGLDPAQEYYAYDFWNDCFVGKIKGAEALRQDLRPGEARMISVRKVVAHPQVLSTDRHIMQGYLDLKDVKWDAGKKRLSGKAMAVGGEPFNIVLALNGYKVKSVNSLRKSATLKCESRKEDAGLVNLAITTPESEVVKSTELKPTDWVVTFE